MRRAESRAVGARTNAPRIFLTLAGLLAANVTVLAARTTPQITSPSNPPTFDVASIKPDNPQGPGPHVSMIRTQPGGRFTAVNASLGFLISNAYQLKPGEGKFLSLPAWANSQDFDVEAEAKGHPSNEEVHLMLQALLADRFKLVVHREVRQLPEYALIEVKPGKTGPQLQTHSESNECAKYDPSRPAVPPNPEAVPPPPPPCGSFIGGRTRLAGDNVNMQKLADALSSIGLGRPVINRTMLDGTYDLTLRYTPEPPPGVEPAAADPSAFPSIFTAIEEQLGLKLDSTSGPVNVLIVDHVEQPSAN